MKKFFTLIALTVALLTAAPSQAQVKFGLKGGLNVTNMSLSSDVIKKDNQTGFFIGPTVKVTVPIVGLAVDGAVLYDQRDAKLTDTDGNADKTTSQRSINIPINLRYGVGLGSLASVYLAAGPQFGFNVGKENFKWNDTSNYELKKSNLSLNVGAGVSLISHLEIGFTYNIALGKTGEVTWKDAVGTTAETVYSKKVRTNAWQVSAAYYF